MRVKLTPSVSGGNSPDRGADNFAEEVLAHPVARDTQHPMGWTSENVAKGESRILLLSWVGPTR